MRVLYLLLLVTLGMCCAESAVACRYSVREVGFVDLDAAPYHLYLHLTEDVDADVAAACHRAAQIELLNAPVIIAEEPGTGPMARAMASHAVPPGGALLISPEDRHTVIRPPGDADPENYYRAAFQGLIDSTMRTEIADALDTFCQVLLVEGPDAAQNARARATATAAIAEITANMDKMDKAVEKTAVLLTITQDNLDAERLLLWSLGLEPAEITEPRIAVLFGRARRLGGVLRGGKVTEKELVRVMALAGTSCECGLERKWMQGPMILMRWDRGVQQRIATHLGFDPESPAIKTEISQILAQGGSGPNAGRQLNTMLAYTEYRAGAGGALPEGESLIEDVPLGDGPIMASAQEDTIAEDTALAAVLPVMVPPADASLLEEDTPAPRPGILSMTGTVAGAIVVLNALLLFVIWIRSRRT